MKRVVGLFVQNVRDEVKEAGGYAKKCGYFTLKELAAFEKRM